jgi:hypothetical protein
MEGFVAVLVTATGRTEMVPIDWMDSPVLSVGLELLPEPGTVEKLDPPSESDTHDVINAFAEKADIDLGDAKTKAEKMAVINEVLAAMPSTEPPANEPDPGNPDVQLVAGDEDDQPVIPMYRSDYQDTTVVSNETPADGDEEN